VEALRPGTLTGEAAAARRVFLSEGVDCTPCCGHQIGAAVNEQPRLVIYARRRLRALPPVRRPLRPPGRRVFPVLLPAVRRRVEETVRVGEPFGAAGVGRVGAVRSGGDDCVAIGAHFYRNEVQRVYFGVARACAWDDMVGWIASCPAR
jgi:hypothetical protein